MRFIEHHLALEYSDEIIENLSLDECLDECKRLKTNLKGLREALAREMMDDWGFRDLE